MQTRPASAGAVIVMVVRRWIVTVADTVATPGSGTREGRTPFPIQKCSGGDTEPRESGKWQKYAMGRFKGGGLPVGVMRQLAVTMRSAGRESRRHGRMVSTARMKSTLTVRVEAAAPGPALQHTVVFRVENPGPGVCHTSALRLA